MKKPSGNKGDELAAVTPALVEYTNKILYDEVWERPSLSKRDRSLITVAALIAMYRPEQLTAHSVARPGEWPEQGRDRRGDRALWPSMPPGPPPSPPAGNSSTWCSSRNSR